MSQDIIAKLSGCVILDELEEAKLVVDYEEDLAMLGRRLQTWRGKVWAYWLCPCRGARRCTLLKVALG